MRNYQALLNKLFDDWYNPILSQLTEASRKISENEFRYVFCRSKYDDMISAKYTFEKYSPTEGTFWDKAFQLICPSNRCINTDVNVYQLEREIEHREMPDLTMYKIAGSSGNARAYVYVRMKDFTIWNDPCHFVNISPDTNGCPPLKKYYLRGNLTAGDVIDFLIAYCDFVPKDLEKRMKALDDAVKELELECKKAELIVNIQKAVKLVGD
ncbi:MAG: hypothetical protein MJZ16_06875 [Bacteroidales bacterium]|nr:hypothetical protein [Bacteroidales bacterium]